MMQKVEAIDEEWDFPYSIIESREGIIIIDQAEIDENKVPVIPVGEPAICIIDGYLGIDGVSDGDLEYYDVSTKSYRKLNTIKRIAPDRSEYECIFNPPIVEDVIE